MATTSMASPLVLSGAAGWKWNEPTERPGHLDPDTGGRSGRRHVRSERCRDLLQRPARHHGLKALSLASRCATCAGPIVFAISRFGQPVAIANQATACDLLPHDSAAQVEPTLPVPILRFGT